MAELEQPSTSDSHLFINVFILRRMNGAQTGERGGRGGLEEGEGGGPIRDRKRHTGDFILGVVSQNRPQLSKLLAG